MSNSSTSRPRSSSAAWRRTSRNTGDACGGLLRERLELAAAVLVVEHGEPAVVGAERADAGVARAAVEEGGGQPVGGRRGELGGEELAALVAPEAVALEQRHEPGGEQHLAARAQLGVADAPLLAALALLADEVDADRPPVADQVVEEEPRRAVGLVGVLEVAVEHPLPDAPVGGVAGDRLGLEHQQHAAREVRVGVGVEPDPVVEVGAEDARRRTRRSARGGGRRRRAPARSASQVGLDVRPLRALDQQRPVVVAAPRQLAAAPRAEQDDRRGGVDLQRRPAPPCAPRPLHACARGRP